MKLNYRSHHVALAFAFSFHKLQGKTIDKLILVLKEHKGRKLLTISFEALYVALSRVRSCEEIRFWSDDKIDLEDLIKMRRSPYFGIWDNNFSENGYWIEDGLNKKAQEEICRVKTKIREIFSNFDYETLIKVMRNETLIRFCHILGIKTYRFKKAAIVNELFVFYKRF